MSGQVNFAVFLRPLSSQSTKSLSYSNASRTVRRTRPASCKRSERSSESCSTLRSLAGSLKKKLADNRLAGLRSRLGSSSGQAGGGCSGAGGFGPDSGIMPGANRHCCPPAARSYASHA